MQRARCCEPRTKPSSPRSAKRAQKRAPSRCRTRTASPPARAGSTCPARRAWTVSTMRYSRNLTSVAFAVAIVCMLAGCEALEQQQPGTRAIRAARVVGTSDAPQLEVALDCRLSGPMQDALDHGIPLTLGLRIVAARSRVLP